MGTEKHSKEPLWGAKVSQKIHTKWHVLQTILYHPKCPHEHWLLSTALTTHEPFHMDAIDERQVNQA